MTFVTAVDIQDAVIALMTASPALTPTDPAAAPLYDGAILSDDPAACQPGQAVIALHLLAEGDADATLGGKEAGTRHYVTYFAALVYVGEQDRSSAAKQRCASLTRSVREALMECRADASGAQLWRTSKFKSPASLYQKGGSFRRSVTFIEFHSRIRTS